MRKRFIYVICLTLTIVVAGMAYAQFDKPQDAIKYRQAVMILLGHHFGKIGAALGGASEDKTIVQDARVVAMLAPLPWEAFLVPGTDNGDTTMSSKVFEDTGTFKSDAAAFEKEAIKLDQVAAGGKMDALKVQFGAVAKTCKACHGNFRNR
ncbi:putative Cytochrome c' [Desulfosarcina cetonica]|uniref:c-type cytochrome n=1 Tax=Desulfosarcina cetonica TaxID=90730 RepID=UPI0006D2B81C|nr:cytochrome c [Desulfosarcina cetonica]VTR69053.1 putative Cytochrome c' [Desulfosarcina cetonica]